MPLIAKLKIVTSNVISQLWDHPIPVAAVLFFSSIVIFAAIYYVVQQMSYVTVTRFRGKNLVNFSSSTLAFQLSESLRQRLEAEVSEELRISMIPENQMHFNWSNFRLRTPSNDPAWDAQFDEMRLSFTRGLTAVELIEAKFQKYGRLKMNLSSYRDNSIADLLPRFVVSHYFDHNLPQQYKHIGDLSSLTQEQLSLHNCVRNAAIKLRDEFLVRDQEFELGGLSRLLTSLAESCDGFATDRQKLRGAFYGEVLGIIAGQTLGKFKISELPLFPTIGDYLYASTMLATANAPSELTPVTSEARFLFWLQLIVSYFLMALLTAGFVKLFGLSA